MSSGLDPRAASGWLLIHWKNTGTRQRAFRGLQTVAKTMLPLCFMAPVVGASLPTTGVLEKA